MDIFPLEARSITLFLLRGGSVYTYHGRGLQWTLKNSCSPEVWLILLYPAYAGHASRGGPTASCFLLEPAR